MNQVGQSINPIKLLSPHAGFASVKPAKARMEGVTRRRGRSLPAIIGEMQRANRTEERIWFVLALSTLGVLVLSLWL
jgi:hypothetical protein